MNFRISTLLSCALVAVTLAHASPAFAQSTQPAPAPAPAPAPPAATSVEVRFTGIQVPTGSVMFVVFDSEAAYNGKAAPVRALVAPVKDGAAAQTITGLKPGRYAIKAFHDVDGDGKMGANPFGTPIEPFAFSNNAKANMGPAVWADAAFDITPGANVQTITIQ